MARKPGKEWKGIQQQQDENGKEASAKGIGTNAAGCTGEGYWSSHV